MTEDAASTKRYLVTSVAFVLAASVISTAAHALGWLAPLERAAFNMSLPWRRIERRDTVVISIDDADYKDLFASTSPLATPKLVALLDAVLRGEPAVMVIDVDPGVPREQVRLSRRGSSQQGTTSIVWAVAPDEVEKCLADNADVPPAGREYCAVTSLPRDADGRVRYYTRAVNIQGVSAEPENVGKSDETEKPRTAEKTEKARLTPTVPWVSSRLFKHQPVDLQDENMEQIPLGTASTNAPGITMSAREVFNIAGSSSGWQSIAGGKIVFVGAGYEAARDMYQTPLGKRSGVELLALATEQELQNKAEQLPSTFWMFILLFGASFAWGLLNWKFRSTWVLFAGLIAIPVVAVAISALVFSNISAAIYLIPTFLAVQLHALFEHIRGIQEKNRNLVKLNSELVATKFALATAIDDGAETERKRLAAELHDDTLGRLSRLNLMVHKLAKTANSDVAEKTISALEDATRSAREVMNNLYPTALDKLGLHEALMDLINQARDGGFEIATEAEPSDWDRDLPRDMQLRLFRIISEVVTNAVKHSKATLIKLTIHRAGNLITFTVEDNGRGMQAQPAAGERGSGHGMQNMRTKVSLLHGTIDHKSPLSDSQSGTRVTITIPARSVSG